ncbi:MAG: hydroxymethylpyrimidine/phosphomethylpyrimidine kinase [Chromatiaceae bacterium]|nr:hydroxymethylpyrimidine/phosphomethylpyrimidine kinase [Chromatiaceae bacterium]MCP5422028.1 hydroxymethylpyrimidine/phosphomethylpyrimidine kinase [Chromatiaceae bacterium]
MHNRPVVLCIGGHDPTGGAGIQADIETVNALDARAVSLITTLTAQDTRNATAAWPVSAAALARQFDTLVDDIRPAAAKIGLLGGTDQIAVLAERIEGLRCPVVIDPVLAAGGGFQLDPGGLGGAICRQLLPLAALATPNRIEARRLAANDDADAAAGMLLGHGVGAVLLTGADEANDATVRNRLYRPGLPTREYDWPLLPQRYHGSGCTLASACAALLARGMTLDAAVAEAQAFTWSALEAAEPVGKGQWLPRRKA